MRSFFIVFFLLVLHLVQAEGTKELEPASQKGKSKLQIGTDRIYNFGTYSSTPDKRIYINIQDPATEMINFGFGKTYHIGGDTTTLYFRIKDPNGNIVYDGTLVPDSGKGFIPSYEDAVNGPKGLSGVTGGYDPLTLKPEVKGDYTIEFSHDNTDKKNEIAQNRVLIDLFDVTVSKNNKPQPGRLWAYQWSINSCGFSEQSYAQFYTLTGDSLVSSINMNGLSPCGYAVMFNSKGTTGSTSLNESRKSGNGDLSLEEYKVFFNKPDSLAFAQDTTGVKLVDPVTVSGCFESDYCIKINTAKGGDGTILLDFNKNSVKDPEDILLEVSLSGGDTCIPWNGRNAFGQLIPKGTSVRLKTDLHKGLINFPLYDAEKNSAGFIVESWKGKTSDPSYIYWDDSDLTGLNAAEKLNYSGCLASVSGCHTWSSDAINGGNNNTINTWWYASQSIDSLDFLIQEPIENILGQDRIICDPNRLVTLAPEKINPSATYSWEELSPKQTVITSPSSASTQVNLSGTTKTIATYVLTATNGSCMTADTVNVLLNQKLPPVLVGPETVCPGAPAKYYVIDPSATSKTWILPPGSSMEDLGDTIVIESWPVGNPAPVIKVVSTYADCPSDTAAITITFDPNAKTRKPDGDSVLCYSAEDGLIVNYSIPQSYRNSTFEWTTDKGVVTNNNSNNIVITWPATPLQHWLVVKETVNAGCLAVSDTLKIRISTDSVLVTANDTSICADTELNLGSLVNNVSGATQIKWSPTTGFQEGNAGPLIKYSSTESLQLKYSVEAVKNGCRIKDSLKVTIRPKPSVSDITSVLACEDSSVTYAIKTKNSTEIQWSIVNDSAKTIDFTPVGANNEQIKVKWGKSNLPATITAIAKGECGNDTSLINIIPRKYEQYKPSGDSGICFTGPTTSVYTVRSNGGKKYTWDLITEPATGVGRIVGPKNIDSLTVEWIGVGAAFVLVSEEGAEDSLCPVGPDTLNIGITDKGSLVASPDTAVCPNSTVTLNASGTGQIQWSPGGQGESITVSPAVTTVYVAQITSGCKDIDSVTVTVYPAPSNLFDPDINSKEYCLKNNSEDLVLQAKPGFATYLWHPFLDTTSTVSLNETDLPQDQTQVILTVTDVNGCMGQDTLLLRSVCNPLVYVPDAFSPNGDPANKEFTIFAFHVQNFQIKIYNRWGEVIFISNDPKINWDGNYKNSPMPNGVYPWIITYQGNNSDVQQPPLQLKGSVTLVR